MQLFLFIGDIPRGGRTGGGGDPGVAVWLLDAGAAAPTLNRLVLEHVPDLAPLLQHLGSAPGMDSEL